MAAQDILRELITDRFYEGDIFSVSYAYDQFEEPLQEAYPSNKHIQAKIRQMLQKLVAESFLDRDSPGVYCVVGGHVREWPSNQTRRKSYFIPDEVAETGALTEGATTRITVNSNERSEEARAACISHYGCFCSVCEFDFEAYYGEHGEGYIQVHHLVPLSKITSAYQVDYKQDLIPMCANCHAVIHRREPPFSVDELKNLIAKQAAMKERM